MPVGKLKAAWETTRYYVGGVYNRADRHHVFLASGGLAFSLLICMVPLVLIVFAVIGLLLTRESITDDIVGFIDNAIPYPEYADFIKEIVLKRIREFTMYKRLAGALGFFGLLFASSGLFGAMRTILNQVYKINDSESILVSKLRDFGLILMVLAYFLLSTTVFPLLSVVTRLTEEIAVLAPFDTGLVVGVVIWAGQFVLITLAFLFIFYMVPTRRPPKRAALASALATAILWVIAKELFGFYLANAVNLQRIYGAYLVGIAVVFWIYYSSIVFILGAEFGQLVHERHQQIKPPKRGRHRFFPWDLDD